MQETERKIPTSSQDSEELQTYLDKQKFLRILSWKYITFCTLLST